MFTMQSLYSYVVADRLGGFYDISSKSANESIGIHLSRAAHCAQTSEDSSDALNSCSDEHCYLGYRHQPDCIRCTSPTDRLICRLRTPGKRA